MSAPLTASVVIAGAGIAGVAAAHELAVRRGVRDVVLVDDRAPLTLTSDKSTECYRNWWPGPDGAMVALVNASIDRLEELAAESGNAFHLTRRGYVFATADPARVEPLRRESEEISRFGAGPLRVHDAGGSAYAPSAAEGLDAALTGADLLLDRALIRRHFPYLAEDTVALLHARRCGWMSAQQLGMYLLERARERGLRLVRAHVDGIDVAARRVRAVRTSAGTIATESVVDAAGPFAGGIARMAGCDLPLHNELHAKVAFRDTEQAVPRGAPFLIWLDPQRLYVSDDERRGLAGERAEWLGRMFPPGVHLRPEGGPRSDALLLIWGYEEGSREVVWPPAFDPSYAEICLRGLVRMIPALARYVARTPKPVIDGGYYTKTRENRPLVGPLPVAGLYALCAFGGFGIMAACGAASLLADHLTAAALPDHAPAFLLSRYDDPGYLARIERWGAATGQL